MKRIFMLGVLGCSAGFCLAAETASVQTKVFLSPVYKIDKIYRSMEGPSSAAAVHLLDTPTPELLWITGFRTEMVADDGATPSRAEYMCHR